MIAFDDLRRAIDGLSEEAGRAMEVKLAGRRSALPGSKLVYATDNALVYIYPTKHKTGRPSNCVLVRNFSRLKGVA